MLPTYVILKTLHGEPLKRVFMGADQSADETEIVIGDPAHLRGIKSADFTVDFVSYDRVFNFQEDVYQQLLLDWQMSKRTSPDAWTRLGHIELQNESQEQSCGHRCQG